jgi:hypothetical protein
MAIRMVATTVTATCVLLGVSFAAGCREKTVHRIDPGPPPALPSADSVVDARWKYIGESETWKPLSHDHAVKILKLLGEAQEVRRPDGTAFPLVGPLNPTVEFSTNDGKTFDAVFSLFNGEVWYCEIVAGREPKSMSYWFPREFSQAELSLLDPGGKVAETLTHPQDVK